MLSAGTIYGAAGKAVVHSGFRVRYAIGQKRACEI